MRGLGVCLVVVGAIVCPGVAGAVPVPAQTSPVTVVPSAGLPNGVHVDHSNANLSVTYFRERVWMVFRTAKWQIADDNARLYVISSADQRHWRKEGEFAYQFFVIEHGRRRILHFNVTRHPSAEWVVQQLREACPEAGPYRYVILDRDSKFNATVITFLKATG